MTKKTAQPLRASTLRARKGALLLFGLVATICHAAHPPPFEIRLLGANPAAQAITTTDPQPAALFLEGAAATGYSHVYPGISLAHYADAHHVEFAFALSQGADPSLIRFLLERAEIKMISSRGHIVYQAEALELYQHAPVLRQPQPGSASSHLSALAANYTLAGQGAARIATPTMHAQQVANLNHTPFNIVPGNVGTNGPAYDFYMSRFELTHRQLIRFLNDAEQNPNNARGSNMHFDETGNIWFHPDRQRGRDEIFTRDSDRIRYNAERVRGDRYSLVTDEQGQQIYAHHPATGISWYGALKYCNWLTLESGRGLEQRAYREGTNSFDWAPVTATNWSNGIFTHAERQAWLTSQGFRLPMSTLSDEPNHLETNTFNEFYKAAAWNGQTNTLYGFGRNTFQTNDAVILDTVMRHDLGLMPVGFFDGINRLPHGPTLANENGFGIHDLTGNVSEWLNDPPRQGAHGTRLVAGGSFQTPLQPVSEVRMVAPHATDGAGGFRPVTTYMPESLSLINVLFCFHTTNAIPYDMRAKYGIPDPGDLPDRSLDPPGLIPDPAADQPTDRDAIIPPASEEPPSVTPFAEDALPTPPGVLMPDAETESPLVPTQPLFPGTTASPSGSDASGTSPPAQPALFALRLESQRPASGVPIQLATPDYYGYTDGTTAFTRFYSPNTQVTLTAPQERGTHPFLYWLRNGVPFSPATSITVDMLSNLTLTAVYLSPQPPPQITLTVNANLVAGVPIALSLADNNGLQHGNTTFRRTYDQGQLVTLTAPSSAHGEAFRGWLRNGQPFANSRTVSVTLFNDTTLTAEYGQAVPVEERRLSINSVNPDRDVPITISLPDKNGQQDGLTAFNRRYDFGADLVVTAPPQAHNGNTFAGWYRDGILVSTNPQFPVNMSTDIILTAAYVAPPPDFVLTVGSDRPNSGIQMIVTTPDNAGQTDGATLFTRHYTEGTSTTVTAPPSAPNGNAFRRWLLNGSPLTTNRTISVTMLTNAEVIAVYRPPDPPPRIYDLQVQSQDPDSGVDITLSVPDINNDSDGSTAFTRSYLEDAAVELTAPLVAPDGNTFVRWLVDGVPYSDQHRISLIMTGPRSVTAEYEPPPTPIRYTLEVETRNPDSLVVVTVTPADVNNAPLNQTAPFERLYDAGTVVTITTRNPAFPGSSIFLQQWQLDGETYSTNATIEVTMLTDRRVTAIYGPPLEPADHVLTVTSQNPDADVPIMIATPDLLGDTNGETTFERTYAFGEDVTLTAPATAPNGHPFSHWLFHGTLLSADQSITVSMIEDVTVTAVYEDLPPVRNLAVRSQNPSSGVLIDLDVPDIHGDQSGATAFDRQYYDGQTVTLTTTPLAPNGRDVFARWERDGTPVTTNTTTTITLYQDIQITAVYAPPPSVTLTIHSQNPDQNVAISVSQPDTLNRTDGSTAFARTYNPGTLTTITAPNEAPNEAPFVAWLLNGQPFSQNPEITLEMLTDYEITAVFGDPPPPRRILVVRSVNPDSDVPIIVAFTDQRANEDGLTPFLRLYDDGTHVTLEAPPTAETNNFRQWFLNGTPLSTNLTTTVIMSQDHELVAVYGPPVEAQHRALTVDSRDPASGIPIEISTPDISGDSNGTTTLIRIYDYGTFTTLTAPEMAATNDYAFLYWERDGTQFSTNRSVSIEMAADIRMTAVFGPFIADATLTVESQNPDQGVVIAVSPADLDALATGTTTFNRTYAVGQNVVLNAPSEVGDQPFLRWLFNGTAIATNQIVDVTLLSDVTMTAVYGDPEPVDTVRLTIASDGPDGPIRTLLLAVSPDINGNTVGTTIIERIYDYGETVTLTAPESSNGFDFSHWSIDGGILSSNQTVSLLILADTTITAVYVEPAPSVGGL